MQTALTIYLALVPIGFITGLVLLHRFKQMDKKTMIKPKSNVYELTDNFTYKDVVVPKGFTTDGVTVKIRFLYMLNKIK